MNLATMIGRRAFRGPACDHASHGCRCFEVGGPHSRKPLKRRAKVAERRRTARKIATEARNGDNE
jgi:hypothetical protein